MATYSKLGVLYYIVYNPNYWRRDQHQSFEVYRLVNGEYHLQIGSPFWMAEISLGIGRATTDLGGLQREVLYWYDERGVRYETSEELAQIERQQRELAQRQAEAERLRFNELASLLEQYRQRFGDLPQQ